MKKIGYLFTGLALGVAISAVSPVMAGAVKTISAKVNNTVSVVLNGEKVQLKTQPIEYNNLNYLPVGEIGRALGLGVSYDKKTDSINIVGQDKTSVTNTDQNQPPTTTTTPLSTTEQPKNDVKNEYKVGETIQFTDATFKVVDVSVNKDFNDKLQEITLNVEAQVNKKPSGLSKIDIANFIYSDDDFITLQGQTATFNTVGGEMMQVNTPVQAKFKVHISKGDTLQKIGITNIVDAWDHQSDRYKNPEKTFIILQ